MEENIIKVIDETGKVISILILNEFILNEKKHIVYIDAESLKEDSEKQIINVSIKEEVGDETQLLTPDKKSIEEISKILSDIVTKGEQGNE